MFQTQETAIKKAFLKNGTMTVQATTGAAKRTLPAQPAASGAVSPKARNRMVAEAAYYIAEHRGFAKGSPLEDWLVAEAQVNTMLYRPRP